MTSIRTLTKVCCTAPCKQIQPWLADAPQSFMHFQAAALEYSHRAEGNTGWCTTSQSHPIPHCKPTHSCNPMQFCVCVSTLPSRRKEVLECLIQFHSNVQHGADNRAVIRVLLANLSHTPPLTLHCTRRNAKCQPCKQHCGTWLWQMPLKVPRVFSSDLVFLWLPGSMPKIGMTEWLQCQRPGLSAPCNLKVVYVYPQGLHVCYWGIFQQASRLGFLKENTNSRGICGGWF